MTVVVIAAAALQAWILFHPEPKLIVWPDSVGYLEPAINAIERGAFTHAYGRGSAYPMFLWAVLWLKPDPEFLVLVQRVVVWLTFAVLATGMAVVVARWRDKWALAPRWVVPASAGFWLLTFVVYPPTAGLAHLVMAEGLFVFLTAVISLAIVVCLVSYRTVGAAVGAGAATFVSGLLTLVKPHWMLGAIALPLALPLLTSPGRRRPVAMGAITGVALALALFALPESRLVERYDAYASRIFGPRSLFCYASDIIYDDLRAEDLSDPFSQELAVALGRILTPEARTSAYGWDAIGFDGDLCMYGEASRVVSTHFAGRPAEESSFYWSSYLRAVAHRPTYLPRRVLKQLWGMVLKPYNAVSGNYFLMASDRVVRANLGGAGLYRRWLGEHENTVNGEVRLPTRPLMLALRVYFVIAGALLWMAPLAALLVISMKRDAVPRQLGALLVAALVNTLAINVLVATVAIYEPRFLAMQVACFSFQGFIATLVLVATGCSARSAAAPAPA